MTASLTFIIPAYNASATLGETLASLMGQTRRDWSAVVVDDGSTDNTASLVTALAATDNRIALASISNRGVSLARNHGLSLATSEWIAFLDADDWVGPSYVAEMMAAASADTDMVYCGYARVSPQGVETTEAFDKHVAAAPFATLAARCPFAIHCVVGRRTIISQVGGFDADLAGCEDWDLWQKAARVGARFKGIDKLLAFYRMSEGSLSTNWARMLGDGLTVLRRGHGPDPRIETASPGLADGADVANYPRQATHFALWCASAAAGAGDDGGALLALVPGPHPVAGNEQSLVDVMVGAWAVGARCPRTAMLDVYAADRARFENVIEALTKGLPQPGWTLNLMSALEVQLLTESSVANHASLGFVAKMTIDLRRQEPVSLLPEADRVLVQLMVGQRRIAWLNVAAAGELSSAECWRLALEQVGWVRLFVRARGLVKPNLLIEVIGRHRRRAFGSLRQSRGYQSLRSAAKSGIRSLRILAGWRPAPIADAEPQAAISGEAAAGHEVEAWENVFASADPWRYESDYEQEKYRLTLELIPDNVESAVELACAEGIFTRALAPRVGTLIATDISRTAIGRAADRCGRLGNISFRQLDVLTGTIPGGQQLITASEFLYYLGGLRQLDLVAGKIRDALVPGGYLVMANHFLLRDDMSRTGFDWDQDYGGKVVHERFNATPGLALETSIVTELYRIDRFRRLREGEAAPEPRIMQRSVEAGLEPSVERYLVRGGAKARRRDVEFEQTWRVPVLAYHRIAEDGPEALAPWRLSVGDFRDQLQWLRSNGYHAVTARELGQHRAEQRAFLGRPVMLTFDDAYADFAEVAWPVLQACDFTAEVFVVADKVGTRSDWDGFAGPTAALMDWATIEDLAGKGVHFGSHLATHTPSTNLTSPALFDELIRSRSALEQRLGGKVSTLAAPYGAMDLRLTQLAWRAGYDIGFSSDFGLADVRSSRFVTPRIEVRGDWTLSGFISMLSK